MGATDDEAADADADAEAEAEADTDNDAAVDEPTGGTDCDCGVEVAASDLGNEKC